MERIQAIYNHPAWQENFARLQLLERDRVFCRHTLEHFLDVARIAYLESLEKGLGISKERIYAAALLHDIGRAAQYRDGTPHEEAGAALAREIMADCGFSRDDTAAVLSAILAHRDPEAKRQKNLAGLLYRADKASRLCLNCPAEEACNWPAEKKNMTINI